MSQQEKIDNIVDSLKELEDDNTVPKNIKTMIGNVINTLGNEDEVSIKVNKALNFLDEVIDDNNMEPYTRTQLWNIVAALEMVC